MSLLILMIVIFAALSLVTVLSELSSRREQQQASAQELAELLGLKEGQTIMAVVDEPEVLYVCLGKDREKPVQKDEEEVT
jgi:uncharacterized protein YpmB